MGRKKEKAAPAATKSGAREKEKCRRGVQLCRKKKGEKRGGRDLCKEEGEERAASWPLRYHLRGKETLRTRRTAQPKKIHKGFQRAWGGDRTFIYTTEKRKGGKLNHIWSRLMRGGEKKEDVVQPSLAGRKKKKKGRSLQQISPALGGGKGKEPDTRILHNL